MHFVACETLLTLSISHWATKFVNHVQFMQSFLCIMYLIFTSCYDDVIFINRAFCFVIMQVYFCTIMLNSFVFAVFDIAKGWQKRDYASYGNLNNIANSFQCTAPMNSFWTFWLACKMSNNNYANSLSYDIIFVVYNQNNVCRASFI